MLSGLVKLRGVSYKRGRVLRRSTASSPEKEAERKQELRTLAAVYKETRFQLVQDAFDFVLPMSNLGYFNLNEGVLGLAGLISSLMGLDTQVKKVLGTAK